jgi:hypothetical protein
MVGHRDRAAGECEPKTQQLTLDAAIMYLMPTTWLMIVSPPFASAHA